MTFLDRLDFSNNKLTGLIPSYIGNLSYLQYLKLNGNALTGAIPRSLGNNTLLREVNLADNKLTGTIPESMGAAAKLRVLEVQNNELSGTIPIRLVTTFELARINLSGNRFDSLPNFSNSFNAYSLANYPVKGFSFVKNRFTFDDIILNMPLATKGADFLYQYLGQDSSICQSKSTLIELGKSHVIALGIDGALTTNVYRWFKNGKLIDRTNVNRLTLTDMQPCQAGVYSCEVTNPAVPGMTLHCLNQNFTLVQGPESCAPYSVATFPNPVQNALNITVVSPPDDVRLVKMYNMLGQQVFATPFDADNLVNGLQINCADFPNGSYFLSFYTEGGQISLTKRVQVLKK
jgi:Secretion system C-terminal sorting domain/Leucine rich repeat